MVSPDPAILGLAAEAGADPVEQTGSGLNEGLQEAVRWAVGGAPAPSWSWPATCRR